MLMQVPKHLTMMMDTIENALFYTLEKDGEDASSCDVLRFETIREITNVGQMRLH